MARLTHKIIVGTGEYEDREGQTKTRWKEIGIMLDNGGIKIELFPMFPEWSGWLKAVPIDEDRQQRPSRNKPAWGESDDPF